MRPTDPKQLAAYEEAELKLQRTIKDQQQAVVVAEEYKALQKAIQDSDARKIAAAKREQAKAEKDALTEQKRARETYLATPLTEREQVELAGLEALANQPGNPDPDAMRTLSDLRVRAKEKTKKDDDCDHADKPGDPA